MSDKTIETMNKQLAGLDCAGMYLDDFLLTWDRSDDEIAAVFRTAEILMQMRKSGISPRVFDSGLAVSLFRDNSTRTRFSFPARPTCSGWPSRTSTRASRRSPTAKRSGKPPT